MLISLKIESSSKQQALYDYCERGGRAAVRQEAGKEGSALFLLSSFVCFLVGICSIYALDVARCGCARIRRNELGE
jgi:hypothetical protein